MSMKNLAAMTIDQILAEVQLRTKRRAAWMRPCLEEILAKEIQNLRDQLTAAEAKLDDYAAAAAAQQQRGAHAVA